MFKWTLTTLFLAFISAINLSAQDKMEKKTDMAAKAAPEKMADKETMMKNSTDMSEKTSTSKDMDTTKTSEKESEIVIIEKPVEPSPEMKMLLEERKKVLMQLNKADMEMNSLITKSHEWDKERNTEKKGQLDTILDKADRLAFSNELRMNLSKQAKVISELIKKMNSLEVKIVEQEAADEKKRQMEAYKKQIEKLERERLALMAKLKAQESNETVVNSTQAVQKKSEENVEYYTITEDTNLQTIALTYYQDHEKWVIIFEHPDNQKVLKQKDPTALIPIGTVLTIPKMTEE